MKPSEFFELEKKHISNMWHENLSDSIELGDYCYKEADLIKLMKGFDKAFISIEEVEELIKYMFNAYNYKSKEEIKAEIIERLWKLKEDGEKQ